MSKEVIVSFGLIRKWLSQMLFMGVYAITLFIVSLGEISIKLVYLPLKYTALFLQYLFFSLSGERAQRVYTHALRTSHKGMSRSILLFIRAGKSLPFFVLYLLKKFIFLVERLFFICIHTIVSLYRFIISAYFRYFLYGFFFCLIVIFCYQSYLFIDSLPSPRSIGKVNFAQSTHLYDRNGKLLYEIYRDVNRTPISVDAMPRHVIDATIAIEDRNFYRHKGISFFGGILRAFKDTLMTNELQGGSTITQQLVKSALLTPERTIERKLKEMVLALWTEQIFSKDEILEMYLNQVPYGGSAYGIEEAADVYFAKKAKDLTLSEAALLAGLPKAPSIYSPFIDPDLALRRRNQVLEQMHEMGYISSKDAKAAIQEELRVLPATTNIRAPHFVMYTRAELETEYGSKKIEEAGFKVTTTLDLDIQEKAEQILAEEVAKLNTMSVSNGAVIVMKPDTGEILAMVGSTDYFRDTFGAFNVTTALRQPGSSIKPLLYALALERGFTAATPIDDSPIIFQIPGGEPYQPLNYDRRYHGRVPIRYALANSYNIPAVKVLNMLGVQSFVDYARDAGIDSWNDSSRFGLSLGLGGGEVTLIDMTQIYSVFANGGFRVEPTPIKAITDHNERVVDELSEQKVRVMNEGVAYILSDILADNTARTPAFGANNTLHLPGYTVSAKTGTTNDYKDAWTIGFNPEVVVGVWIGNNDNGSMHSVPGSIGAGPIFNRLMTYLIEEKGMYSEKAKPEQVVSRICYGGRTEYFLRGTENQAYCHSSVIEPRDRNVRQEATRVTQ